MNFKPQADRSDLYIDESGYHYIGQAKYRFFILTGVIIDPEQRQFANSFFLRWRRKHLTEPYRALHATDFFENRKASYLKHELSFARNFNNAVKELMDAISYINFEAKVFYIDLPNARKRFKIEEPPKLIENTRTGKREYKEAKRNYSEKLKKSFGNKTSLPLDITISKAYEYHFDNILHSSFKTKAGYVNIESQYQSDQILIQTYHKYIANHPDYEKNILGIRLHNKKSLDAGIELADWISYISCQTLRFSHRLYEELKDIPSNRHALLKNIRSELRRLGIELVDVTNEPI